MSKKRNSANAERSRERRKQAGVDSLLVHVDELVSTLIHLYERHNPENPSQPHPSNSRFLSRNRSTLIEQAIILFATQDPLFRRLRQKHPDIDRALHRRYNSQQDPSEDVPKIAHSPSSSLNSKKSTEDDWEDDDEALDDGDSDWLDGADDDAEWDD